MGGSTWSDSAYSSLRRDYSTKTQAQVFTNNAVDKDMNPKGLKFRESRDSDTHPESVAIIVGVDETGSMGQIPEVLIRHKLGALMTTLIKHGVPDAHVLFMGLGDHYTDNSPLQVGQFEAGTSELDQWLTKIYLEGKGGGNGGESYLLTYLVAARHTSIDCFEKRQEKGFLFTIGDENCHQKVEADRLKDLLGYSEAVDISLSDILEEAQKSYHVFHLDIQHGSDCMSFWKKYLGENVLPVQDYENVAEIIASTVAVVRGADLANVVAGFDDHTAKAVSNALVKVNTNMATTSKKEGVVKL